MTRGWEDRSSAGHVVRTLSRLRVHRSGGSSTVSFVILIDGVPPKGEVN